MIGRDHCAGSDSVFPSMIAHCGVMVRVVAVNRWVRKGGGLGLSMDRPVGIE